MKQEEIILGNDCLIQVCGQLSHITGKLTLTYIKL